MAPEPATMSDFTIRAAGPQDSSAVEEMLRGAELPLDGLRDQFGDSYALAETDTGLIGVVGIEQYGDYGLLRSAVVLPEWRGKGVGEALTRDRIDWSRRRGLHALYLLTTTAAEYFPRFGFMAVDRGLAPNGIRSSREFSEACPSSAAFMMLVLREEAFTSLTEKVAIMLGARDRVPGDIPRSKA
jgi:amino-acid N-acetyltransferase